jgi:enamine deaminase RidA (YjgF/YER057c/UK114 family)
MPLSANAPHWISALRTNTEISMRANVFPDGLSKRIVGGRTLYSPVVSFDLGGYKLVFVSGLLARNAAGDIVGAGDMAAQIHQVGTNLKAALSSVGATLDDLVRTSTYTTRIDEFFQHADARHEYLGKSLPTSTTVEVTRLSHPDFMVEIEAMAILAPDAA